MILGGDGDGMVLVFGRTLASARALRDGRAELAGARLGSPLAGRSLDGLRVRSVYVEDGLERMSPAMLQYVRHTALVLRRSLQRARIEQVFYVVPAGGGAVVPTSAEEYLVGLRAAAEGACDVGRG